MELPSLVKQVLAKTAPMSQLEHDKINQDCRSWYESLVKKVEAKKADEKSLNLFDKAVLQLDSWYVRLGFALFYFVIVRYIQGLMRVDSEDDDED